MPPSAEPTTSVKDESENSTANGSERNDDSNATEPNEDSNEVLSDLEELIENPVDIDLQKYPEGAKVRKKRVLESRLTDPFSILPNGWVEITHNCGLPVYLHKATRVCTFSRPYFLGHNSVRKHAVPASAIPCYYTKKCQADAKDRESSHNAKVAQLMNTPAIEIKTAGDEGHHLEEEQIYDYAKSLFKFKTIDVVRFSNWSDTRNYQRAKKREQGMRMTEFDSGNKPGEHSENDSFPGLPLNTKLITVPALNELSKPSQRILSLNPIGKSSISLLHDFVQKVLKNAVQYDFMELTNVVTPYRCVARLKNLNPSMQMQLNQSISSKLKILHERYERENGSQNEPGVEADESILGVGFGRSKRVAKAVAAEKVLSCLIPGLKFNEEHVVVDEADEAEEPECKKAKTESEEMFEMLGICDSLIPDLCYRIGQPQPYMILTEIVKRNSTMADAEVMITTNKVKHQRHEFVMNVGKNEVKVYGGNKKDAIQKAAQLMLQKLYPKAKTWGDIFRIYSVDMVSMQKEAYKYKRKMTSQPADEIGELFAVTNESMGNELRAALENMEGRFQSNSFRTAVLRPPLGYTAPPLTNDDCAHFNELCGRYAHLFADNDALQSIIE